MLTGRMLADDPSLLVGDWSIERSLLDRITDQVGVFLGTLTVEPSAEGFDWREDGQLHWGGRTTAAFRHLSLRIIDGAWWMTFGDGRPFHPWLVDSLVVHPCAEDLYRGLITVLTPGTDDPEGLSSLDIRWEVTGPEKDQLIITHLRR